MPIYRCNGKIIFFAHVPKCAGSSVEDYLISLQVGQMAFLDRQHLDDTRAHHWSTTSPQHISGAALAHLFPASFFDAGFAILRAPVARFKSAFWFQKYTQRRIPSDCCINGFVKDHLSVHHEDPHWIEGHFLPQHAFFHPNLDQHLFRLESDGLAAVKSFLDDVIIGGSIAADIPFSNPTALPDDLPEADRVLTPQSLSLLEQIYAKDFAIYGDPSIKRTSQTEHFVAAPDAFDPQRYLSLHPDVDAAGADPTDHYLRHGIAEGRAWK